MNTAPGAGAQGSGEVLLTSGRIAGDWYYVSWVPVEEYEEYLASHLSMEEFLEAQEFDNDTEVFVVQAADADRAGDLVFLSAMAGRRGIDTRVEEEIYAGSCQEADNETDHHVNSRGHFFRFSYRDDAVHVPGVPDRHQRALPAPAAG